MKRIDGFSIRRLLALMICAMIFVNGSTTYAAENMHYETNNMKGIVLPDDEFEDIQGDVNQDGYVNCEDALLVLKHVAKLIKLSGTFQELADMDEDNLITAKDALEILRVAVN